MWHGYILVYNIPPEWLNDNKKSQAWEALHRIGTQHHLQPAHIAHIKERLDGRALVIESEFEDSEITREAIVATIAEAVELPEATVDAVIEYQIFAKGEPWMTSGDACREYLHDGWQFLKLSPFGQSGNWDLIFQDEFDADVLNTDIWTPKMWWGANTNTDGLAMHVPDDAYLQDGMLRLRTQERDMVASDGTLFHYTTGMVTTGGMRAEWGGPPPTFDFTYGYVEIRSKVASGQGLDSAFWLMPSRSVTGTTFPPWEGEIDVFEILGHKPNEPRMAYFWEQDQATVNISPWTGPDFSDDFHVFAVEWNQDAIIWYVDGIERFRHEDDTPIQSSPMFLILALATGGWFGFPDESTPFPSYFDIDYVRVWKKILP